MEIKKNNKELYEAPSTLVYEVKIDGVICASGGNYPEWNGEDI